MIYLRNNKIKNTYLGDKKLSKIYLGDKLVWHKPTFDVNEPDYVEIAGIKWAKKNVGATSITDYGLYFQWGDTQGYTKDGIGEEDGKKAFNWSDYTKFTSDGGNTFKKYNDTDDNTELALEDDAAHANMKGSWRMPTEAEVNQLLSVVTKEWTQNYLGSSVNGLLCTDKNDTSKTLFFPACGDANDGKVNYEAETGNYWSRSLGTNHEWNARGFNFAREYANFDDDRRCGGYCVRGVLAEN